MSYISASRMNDIVRVWECNNGKIQTKDYPAIYEFYFKDKKGKFTSIYNEPLRKFVAESHKEFKEAREVMEQSRIPLYESDIRIENKVLAKYYHNATPSKQNITFFDIEIDYDPNVDFQGALDPYAPINAISLHHYWTNTSIVMAIPPPGFDMEKDFDKSLYELCDIRIFKTETELLRAFLREIHNTSILSGWNSDGFDIPYIAERVLKVLGPSGLAKLSFPDAYKPRRRDFEEMGRPQVTYDLYGRVHLDYMRLLKKFEVTLKQSYRLEAIAEEYLPHLPKLSYKGSLAKLYTDDFSFFVRYNIRDTEILKGLEDKLGFVQLANTFYVSSSGLAQHVYSTIPLADQTIINYCNYELDKKVPDWSQGEAGSIQGAYVLYPNIGLHKWVFSIDINSLYPSAIRCINISPETQRGYFDGDISAWEKLYARTEDNLTLFFNNGAVETHKAKDWVEILRERNLSVSGYGVVFDQTAPGIIPSVLADWYKSRKGYQKLLKEYKHAYSQLEEDTEKYNEAYEKADQFDKLQFIFKIRLNALYGALSNERFRFFNLKNAESVTATGRMILRHQTRKTGEILDGEYWFDPLLTEEEFHEHNGIFPSKSIIYGDTDSTYAKLPTTNLADSIKMADEITEMVNESYPEFVREAFLVGPGFDELIRCGREVVASAALFVEKKRYTMRVLDSEGTPCDKLKTMGLEMKKTTTPKPVAKKLEAFVSMILNDEDWGDISDFIVEYKESLVKTDNIFELGIPKGIKKVEDYTAQLAAFGEKTRLPGHIAAAIHYNQLRSEYGDTESDKITSGSKIKIYYLTTMFGRFKSIAVPGDMEELPPWFISEMLPYVDKDKQLDKLVDGPLRIICTALKKDVPTRQTIFENSIFEW